MKTVSGGNDKLPEKGIGKTPDTALLHAYNATFVEKLRPTMIDIFIYKWYFNYITVQDVT